MIPDQPPKKVNLGNVLVIGGCGFLGHHIVDLLLTHEYSANISVLDISTIRNRRPASDGVTYFEGDITSLEDNTRIVLDSVTGQEVKKQVSGLLSIFSTIKPDVVIHTASPNALGKGGSNDALYKKVNVNGTNCVIEACQDMGVKALVYTSSASVVSDNSANYDLINADETWPIVPKHLQTEYYSWTKAEAEAAVLSANRSPSHPNLLTCALRPAGIFGPGDVQLIPPIITLHTEKNRTNWQLGSNTNLFDFSYVVNVANAHLLAASALITTSNLSLAPLDHERVDGEAFFITNDSPVPFWDFARMVWKAGGKQGGTEDVWVLSRSTGLFIGAILETLLGAVGRAPNLTTKQVKYACMTRYYNIDKARKRLGYVPIVGLEEGVQRAVAWYLQEKKRK